MKISIVVPLYNEEAGIEKFHHLLKESLDENKYNHEIIYVNDGSTDNSLQVLNKIAKTDSNVKVVNFSRNFGKEYALSAGYDQAEGDMAISMDSDGQHPPKLISKFIDEWNSGSRVVVGIRKNSEKGISKKLFARLYYMVFNRLSGDKTIPGSTDYRLLDKQVIAELTKLKENNRITRGLIDWLGFKRSYIYFESPERIAGKATYSFRKLLMLAQNSIVSMSSTPLYLFGLLGTLITAVSLLLGLSVIIEQLILGDPLNWNFTGTAQLSILILFLIGLVLISQGIISLYISQINLESKNRPNYVIDKENSIGIK
jgi:dolichol-phosphate mannosyltransferase